MGSLTGPGMTTNFGQFGSPGSNVEVRADRLDELTAHHFALRRAPNGFQIFRPAAISADHNFWLMAVDEPEAGIEIHLPASDHTERTVVVGGDMNRKMGRILVAEFDIIG